MATREIHSATLIAVGTELTTGQTRDTNSGDLAAELTDLGVVVDRLLALPDDLATVTDAIVAALERSDLLILTGGLGPTPDDLTREAIAAACGETPFVDGEIEAWLEDLFARRALPMPDTNRKQAWRIAGAISIDNGRGTAPGWFVDRPDGRVIVALPGPPSEMVPMWHDGVLPRLRERGLGTDRASVTLRLIGIGESALAELLGEARLRRSNPTMATYARPDAVDLRISAVAEGDRPAVDLVADAETDVEPLLAPYCFGRGTTTWAQAIEARLDGRQLALIEIGTGGQLMSLFGAVDWIPFAETLAAANPLAYAHRDLVLYASRVREVAGVKIGLAVRARERGGDMAVTVATDIDGVTNRVTRTAFLTGEVGRRRAALTAAAELWRRLDVDPGAKG